MEVFLLPPKLRAITTNKPTEVVGHYVYRILDNGEVIYIGAGTKRRAWNLFPRELETIRLVSKDFQIEILQDRLTKEEANKKKYILLTQHDSLLNQRGYIEGKKISKASPLFSTPKEKAKD